ncbi:helix-turn-helix domain-containing protein [Roseomonas marmotae]|uniref:Helix-turn-helix domain-containing protein n=1 Tax=Roseomonas marmotae TaxID=2768161 RepID=A0ABS3KII4_9PROT|nr:helix-turn-helix domain-containing protein [Roseomonas marmotae]
MTPLDLLTTEDLSRELGIHRCTLHTRLKKRGISHTLKIGRRVYFSREVLNSLLVLPG